MLATNYAKDPGRATPRPIKSRGVGVDYNNAYPIQPWFERKQDGKLFKLLLTPDEATSLYWNLHDAIRLYETETEPTKPASKMLWELAADFGATEKLLMDALIRLAHKGILKPSIILQELFSQGESK